MAFDIAQDGETPKFTVLSQYSVERTGQYPVARATFEECVYMMDGPATVTLAEDLDGDGHKETLTVPGLGEVPSMATRVLCTQDSTVVGTISNAVITVVTPAVVDGTGIVITPAVHSAKLTLGTPPSTDLTGVKVGVVKRMPVGTPAYRRARAGKTWQIVMDGANPQSMQQMATMLGKIYFNAVKAALTALGVSKTDAEISAALQMLASQGTNIDGIFAAVGEALEITRRSGGVPFLTVFGDAPVVTP